MDLFLECEDDNISSYPGDTIPYSCAEDLSSVMTKLQRISKTILSGQFSNFVRTKYHMEVNPGKSRILLSSSIQRVVPFDNVQIALILNEKLVGMTFDLDENLKRILVTFVISLKKNLPYYQLHEPSLDKRKMLLKPFIESQFSYCPLRTLNNKINRLYV